jgi:acetyl esterase/lipase
MPTPRRSVLMRGAWVLPATAPGATSLRSSPSSRRDGGPAPVLQLLIYPVTDFTTRRRSRELFGDGFLLTDPEMDWYETNYLGPRASMPRTRAHLRCSLMTSPDSPRRWS